MLTNTQPIPIVNPIALFPNPCNNDLFVFDWVNQHYQIWTLVGQCVGKGQLPSNGAIDVVGIRNGVYIVKLENGEVGTFVKKWPI